MHALLPKKRSCSLFITATISIAMCSGFAGTALAQRGGYKPIPADSLPGTSKGIFYKAIGDSLRQQHTLDRTARWWDWIQGDRSLAKRFLAQSSAVYNSATSWTGKNCVSPVKDQTACNSCWAFATTATLEAAYCIEDGFIRDGAEQTLLECRTGDIAVSADRCALGNDIIDAYDIMRGRGIDQEFRRPYNTATFAACAGAGANQTFYGIDGVQFLAIPTGATHPPVADIKTAVIDGGAVTVGILLTQDFNNPTAGVAIISTAADVAGLTPANSGHVVSIVGWSDTLQAWRVKNSWGTTTTWGSIDAGFTWLSYGDLSIQAGSYSFVTPQNKLYDATTAMRLFAELAAKLIIMPKVWTENPAVQFPPSLGFPKSKQTVVQGFQWAINNSLISRAVVATWPASVRSRFN